MSICYDAVQGEELVIDESQAAIEPLPNRDRAPLPEPPVTPGMPHTFNPFLHCAYSQESAHRKEEDLRLMLLRTTAVQFSNYEHCYAQTGAIPDASAAIICCNTYNACTACRHS